ncbi:MAG TPA: hypothetical protein VIN10_12825 [Bacteroidales bacterium]
MNKKPVLLFTLIAIFIFFFNYSKAQELDSLAGDSEKFYQFLSNTLLNTPSKAAAEKSQITLDRFYKRWSIGRFNKAEKDQVRYLVEAMRKKNLKTYPFLYDYVYTLTLISESKLTPRSVIAWHMFADSLLNNPKTKDFTDLLSFTNEFLESEYLNNITYSWNFRQADYYFDLDTGFQIKFESLNLVCSSKKDSTVILKTKGTYVYNRKLWVGQGGTVEWSRFGKEKADEIYVQLSDYKIDLKQSTFVADSTVLYYKKFFSNPILGHFVERVTSSPPNSRSSYPRFESYLKNFSLKNVYPYIDYYGGFYLNGLELFGNSGPYDEAYVSIVRGDNKVGRIKSDLFSLQENQIESAKAEVTFFFDNDSLYHPGLRFRYKSESHEILLFSKEEGSNLVPFFDSYHQLDIYSPALSWNLDSLNMYFKEIKGVSNINNATLISSSYFSVNDFYTIQGLNELNPMYSIQNYLKIYNDKEIKLNALAAYMKKSPEQVSALLINLANNGFLVYDASKQTALVKDRFYSFLDAKSGRADYDVIKLKSKMNNKPNASVNINDLRLDLYGVKEVVLSDSQQVFIYPYNQKISIRKNRNITFDGQVRMGLFDFYSRNNTFIYDTFMIHMNYIDSLVFNVYKLDSLNRKDSLVRVQNIINELNGRIYIDQPFNKSGLKDFPEYPMFISDEDSYVYFNRRDIQDSTLLPETFYFKLDPFKLDSILTFTTEGMEFQGTLVSAGIFPNIRQPLVVMPDYSLGFNHITPDSGYPVYANKGNYSDSIFLSNAGFRGSGLLSYLSADFSSDNFIFYPDSLVATSQNFVIEESPDVYDFPFASGDTVDVKWSIDTNVMAISNREKPFTMYTDSWLSGMLYLNPEFLHGDGSFHFDKSEIQSSQIDFRNTDLVADSAKFFLRKDVDTLVFKSMGYLAKIDFAQKKGWFDHIYDNSFVEFPYNKFISNLDEAEWDMVQDKIYLHSNLSDAYIALDTLSSEGLIDYKLSGPEFISVDPNPDSIIRFFAGQATYNLNDFTIDVEQVRMVKAADAAIFPSNEYLKILRDGGILTLQNARIILDTLTKYHEVVDAKVDILNKQRFIASGYVNYMDRNKTKQPIFMRRVTQNSKGITTGFGDLEPTEIFFLSPEYFFTGQIGLIANNKFLQFSGGYRINEDCVGQEGKWVSFEKFIDPNNISFELSKQSVSVDQKSALFGMAYSQETSRFYPLVLEPLKNPNDQILIDAYGSIAYDTANNSFFVQQGIVSKKENSEGNFVSLNLNRCVVEGSGIFNLDVSNNVFKATAAGAFNHLIIPDSTYLDVALMLNFFLDQKALAMISDSLLISNTTIKKTGLGKFPLMLKKILGTAESEKLTSELSLYGQVKKMPDALKHTIIFSEVKLKWDSQTRSFVSQGPIGIGYVNGQQINKYVSGYLQIEKSTSGPAVSFYLKINKAQWYFFTYKNGIMQIISSDNALNDYIETLPGNSRILNENSDVDYYEFVISTRSKSVNFLRDMEEIERR